MWASSAHVLQGIWPVELCAEYARRGNACVLGENDAAIEELRNANETRCPWFFQILADPRLKPLENLPEFVALKSAWAAMEAEARDPA